MGKLRCAECLTILDENEIGSDVLLCPFCGSRLDALAQEEETKRGILDAGEETRYNPISCFDIDSVIKALPDGNRRLTHTPTHLSLSWFPDELAPHFGEEIMSDYGMPTEHTDLEADFNKEVDAIKQWLEDNNVEGKLLDYEKSDIPSVRKMFESIDRRSQAISLWNRYAIPLRIKKNWVYRIWAPRDIYGSPMIKRIRIEEFIMLVAEKTSEDRITLFRLKKRLRAWKRALFLIVLLLIATSWRWILK
jgi:hypothetical protein